MTNPSHFLLLPLLTAATVFGACLTATAAGTSTTTNHLVIHADAAKTTISKNIYGQFSEHLGHGVYGGIWVGEASKIPNTRGIRNDVVAALKGLKLPVLRWPGGCFADEYHWMDGVGPQAQRPAMINTHWGGLVESNAFGTHEFLDLCEQVGCDAYVCGNVGSGSVEEMMEWVEYMTSDSGSPMASLRRKNGREKPWKVKFFGVGNESWGCGGNMRPEFYADNYRRYNTFVKDYDRNNRIFRIASGANEDDYNWTGVMMTNCAGRMNGLSLHYYTLARRDWKNKDSATDFDESGWYETMWQAVQMLPLVEKHEAIMDQSDPQKKVGLIVDEWGTWFAPEPGSNPGFLYQQNTLRDALVAGITLNIFNNHADRIKMANIAQMVNVLQSIILTDNEKMVLTPTYHVFEMYAVHQNARLLPVELESANYSLASRTVPAVNVSASKDDTGKIHVTLCNLNPNAPALISCDLTGVKAQKISGRVLTARAMNARNTFDQPEEIKPAAFTDCQLSAEGFSTTLPPKSVVALEIE